MILIEKARVVGLEEAVRGMRNPMNSWERSDSRYINCGCENDNFFGIGDADFELMSKLADGGPVHAKYRRMIVVYADITAPLYWWKEFDTYKVGTVENSCSTMHKIHAKEFSIDDFSHEHLIADEYECFSTHCGDPYENYGFSSVDILEATITALNYYRKKFLETNDKKFWWQMIQLLPSSYNQKRTIMVNYEVLAGIYKWRKEHKLDEWRNFCCWILKLPYSQLITREAA